MLVLSRRSGERIIIGDSIEVTVIEVRGERVKLGFKAPSDVTIQREEIRHREPATSNSKATASLADFI